MVSPVVMTSTERIRLLAMVVFAVVVTALFIVFRAAAPGIVALSFEQAITVRDFPALEAYSQLNQIAVKPHPFNSTENVRIYHYLLDTLNGYKNSSKADMQVLEFDSTLSFPQLLVYFPGTTNATVMVSAHFDSREMSPGASDDGAGVTVLLQMVRLFSLEANKSQNSVLFFFNNGEEKHPVNSTDATVLHSGLAYNPNPEIIGLEGSARFILSPKWNNFVKNIKVVVNLEGGGGGGKPILMRSTTDRLSNLYTTLPYPHMNSVFNAIIALLDSRTDYEVYRQSGIPSLDICYYENRRYYHTKEDSIDHISPEDVQYMGSNTLAVVKQLRQAEWINDLKVDPSPSPFYDHFGGRSGVVLSPLVRWLVVGVIILGLLGTVLVNFKQLKIHHKEHTAVRHLWIHSFYNTSAAVVGFVMASVAVLAPFTSGFFGKNASTVQWTSHHFLYWVHNNLALSISGLIIGSVVSVGFIIGNLPMMYLVGAIGVARVLVFSVYGGFHEYLTPTQNEIVRCAIIVALSVYPTVLLLDIILDIARATLGMVMAVMAPALIAYTGAIILPIFVGIESMNGRRILVIGLTIAAICLSIFSLIRASV
ncbi:Zn-dependent exopeptidase [Rhizoclosmatium globosum]|uniref:Peptide hydrolase n=1 Tax=Rhizoclosmatium globosum TaxID=329046 RepID=A0A1Y2CBA2_9FUNG|nr:Zn-dependent exopeptidase [Rhizoclosmatium globosum]|eukprot:ORY44313.1 Zn-dependent exopeptidase [Rhizoclosmatium globosum]